MRTRAPHALAALATALLSACASPAPIPEVQLGPDPANTLDDLVATVDGAGAVSLAWYVDDERVPETGDRIPASMTERGQVWRVVATSHGEKDTASASASLTVRNARPGVLVDLGPDVPEAGDALVVAAAPWDADDDPVSVVYAWSRDGVPVEGLDGDRVPADTTRRGETWTVRVEANDGFAWSEPVEASASILNGVPAVISASLSPALPTAADALVARVQAEDPDGDELSMRFTWRVDGGVVQEGPSARLEPGPYDKGSVVEARVTLSDALGAVSESVPVGAVTITNRPPSRPTVQVLPEDPVPGQALRCELTRPSTDPDGDKILAYRASWTVDDALFDDAETTTFEDDRVPPGQTEAEQTWRCAMQAWDGEAWSGAATDEVEVAWDGFQASQQIAGRTVTCTSVATTADHTTCTNLRVDGQAFPNGLTCATGWSATASPRTDHAAFCALVTGRAAFTADYGCSTTASRVTWRAGSWGSYTDNGLTRSLRCFY